ncbi:MAG: right-handed parallel beta-helix repeat-containing protein [Lentimicrobium sp.]|nr:right-handed parallel beta-helix repeat-containing protein [Lentimicrobium sp.]
MSFHSYSQPVVEVGGLLTGNTTWTSDNSYLVTDDLLIPAGVELTILPGVTVRFQANRGLFVEYGSLKVLGNYQNVKDTVRFLSYEGQLWKGISLISVGGANNNIIDHALIERADMGIDIRSSSWVVVRNSTIQNCLTNDIRLSNSSDCIITENRMEQNGRVGIEIYSTGAGNTSSDNQITYNYISDSRYTNLLVRFDYGGGCRNNQIKYNLFYGAEAGIYIDNSSLNSTDNIIIQSNVFHKNGGATIGFGISTGMDNTLITNNLFWQNEKLSVQLRRGFNSVVANNIFYQNANCLAVNLNAKNANVRRNTFAENTSYLLNISEAAGFNAEGNNFLNNLLHEAIVRNNSFMNIDISGQFWGSLDTTLMQSMIWDYHDDAALGELNYLPFLPGADTIAPVSPPYQPKRQIVDGNTLISWRANPEADLQAYAIYRGDFRDYRFALEPVMVADTFLILQGIQVEQTIAITAFDLAGPGDLQKKTGHESPYAFAVTLPFAGSDTAICGNTSPFLIQRSTVPFIYDQPYWETSGDGEFDNINLIQASYYPGPQDIEKGYVILSLSALQGDLVFTDSFRLTLSKLPNVNAGEDLVMPFTECIQIQDVEAGNFDELQWTSMGDGYFNNTHEVNPVYTFGDQDLISGNVSLIVSVVSACGVVSDTLNITIRNQFSVEGRVLTQQIPVSGAVVLAITSFNGRGQEVVQVANADIEGIFRFDNLYAGNYWFDAIPDTLETNGLMPSYYAGKHKWQHAYLLPLVADTYHVEIELNTPGFQLPEGNASISGKFELPSSTSGYDNYCRPWFTDDFPLYCDGGLSNVTILLFNDKYNIPMDFALTDHEGRFIFRNLPYGNYIIDAELPGFETTVSSSVAVNQEISDIRDVRLRIENNNKISIYLPELASTNTWVYPNPTKGVIQMHPECSDQQVLIEIYTMAGRKVLSKSVSSSVNIEGASIMLDFSALPDGHYIGRAICDKASHPFRFIVLH